MRVARRAVHGVRGMNNARWLARVAASAAVRRLVYIVIAASIALIGSLLSGKAHAQDYSGCNVHTNKSGATCPDRQQAWSTAKGKAQFQDDRTDYSNPIIQNCAFQTAADITSKNVRWKVYDSTLPNNPCENSQGLENGIVAYTIECPVGKTWDNAQKICKISCPNGAQEDAFNPGTCMTNEKCQARSAGYGSANVYRTWTSRCVSGCQIDMISPLTTNANGQTVHFGTLQTTAICAANATPDETKKPNNADPVTSDPPTEECLAAGSNQTYCLKPNGNKCARASTGREICWTPTEVGEKTDGPVVQKRCNGASCPDLPDKAPPPGDNFVKGPSVTDTTSKPGTTTTTTTTTNYTTITGGPAGPTNQGTPIGGTGTTPNGEDGTDGTAGGGTDCDTAPITTGDPVLGMVATQAWATRCAVEAGNAAAVSGDIGNCNATFTVEGDNANAEQLRGLRETICPGGAAAASGDGTTAEGALDGGDDGLGNGFAEEGTPQGGEGLDDEGLGFDRSCPTMPPVTVFATTVTFDNSVMCDWLALGGQLVLVLAALASIRILAGGV